ncbi:oligosaccharide flippase family protein [Dokdonia donghaensis]|uniref:Polysaccharide biosynthesis protein C-terminal domain-containing protein n=1 Tax=Dokdonia donghaensis DSW-1 TaxID=1300343 RepID=A0A0A2GZ34_9FLAO|nr:oligosaccharide flippase family protein [Dokdonia donghaensis]ANH61085.1 Putative O-antigen transporter [Dokdonia donghaensis DSW-1]KGO05695.1 hypothetical protein NV36_01735 [Dokdonia donghaensis DSW-1]
MDQTTKSPSLASNFLFSLLLNISKIAAPILIIPYVYRQVIPEDMGRLQLALTVMTYFYVVGDLGTYIYGFREVCHLRQNRAKLNNFFTHLFFVRTIINLLALISFIVYANYIGFQEINPVYYTIAGIQIFGTFFNVEWVFEGLEKFKFISIKTLVLRFLIIIFTFIFINGESADELYLLSICGFILLNNLISFVNVFKYVSFTRIKRLNFGHLKRMIIIFFMINWTLLYFQLDKLILGEKKNYFDIIIYVLGERVVLLCASVIFSFIMVVTPKLTMYLKDSPEAYHVGLKKTFEFICLLLFPFCCFIVISSAEILLILGGESYQDGIVLFTIFCSYIILYIFMESLKTNVFLVLRKESLYFVIILIAGILNLLFKYFFFEALSSIQILFSTLIVIALCLLVLFMIVYKKFNITVFSKVAVSYFLYSIPLYMLYFVQWENSYISLVFNGLSIVLFFGVVLYFNKDVMLIKIFEIIKHLAVFQKWNKLS